MKNDVAPAREALLTRLGLARAPLRFEEALTHASYANEHRADAALDNQRLEFLGDAVLDLCVSELLLDAMPQADEGVLSRAYGALVNADALAEWARANGVGAALAVGRGADLTGIREQNNVLADALEAVVAAVYLEGGMPEARRVAELIVGEKVRSGAPLSLRDPKTTLQERVQAQGSAAPTYRTLNVEGPSHDQRFVIGVEVDGKVLAEGRGRTKKSAEQGAARAALDVLDACNVNGTATPESPEGRDPP